jgi:hypothetical protein
LENRGFSLCEKWAGVLLEAKLNKSNWQVWGICMCGHRLMVDVVRGRGKTREELGGWVYRLHEKQNTPKEYDMLGLCEADNSAGKCSYRKKNLKVCGEQARCDRARARKHVQIDTETQCGRRACVLMQQTTLWPLRSMLHRARRATLQALEGRQRRSEAVMRQDGER